LEQAALDQQRAFGWRAVVIERETGELVFAAGVEADVEQLAAVLVVAEHVERDEAGAGEVALVAKNAVQLERMSDALVDLQHHLVGHQDQIEGPARAGRGRDELERLARHAWTFTRAEAGPLEHLDAALLAIPVVLAGARS